MIADAVDNKTGKQRYAKAGLDHCKGCGVVG